MEFLRDNWFWIVVFVFFILMHAGGHGGHGGHGRSGRTSRPDERERAGRRQPSPPLMQEVRMGRLNIKVVTWSLGIFAEFSYLICVLYGLIVPETMHMTQFLEIALPGFTWLTVSGFVIGAVQSFLYGVYAGLVFTPIYNFVDKRWGA